MKTRYTTIDILCSVAELKQNIGLRVQNVYDIDSKTYLIKLNKPEQKCIIMFESGYRIHSTQFDWPKNMFPSNFAMKMRKHLKGRRLEKIDLLGIDRIIDMQFGSDQAAYHVIVELYDRGNVVLTDHEYTILNILRQRTDQDSDVRFVVREKYPVEGAKSHSGILERDRVLEILAKAEKALPLKSILNPHVEYGSVLLNHAFLSLDMNFNKKNDDNFKAESEIDGIMKALQIAEQVLVDSMQGKCKGYILMTTQKKAVVKENESSVIQQFTEFIPHLYKQYEKSEYKTMNTFNEAVDEFFSSIGSQKLDMKIIQQEKQATKKINNVKKDHVKRIDALQKNQVTNMLKGRLIQDNEFMVSEACHMVNECIMLKKQWTFIENALKTARQSTPADGPNPTAHRVVKLKLSTNHIVMALRPKDYETGVEENVELINVDINLEHSAQANARMYFEKKKFNFAKEMKTNDSTQKALKNAEKKMAATLKEVTAAVSINKARKIYWFEKFLWFISSENHIVIAGRDQQQNELIVKKHLRPGDIYVHADLHGASSVVIKNPSGIEVSPNTLQEAGSMAICNSGAWNARIITSAWWVRHNQVSKTAPTGEYLTTGSFMIRGKKNFMSPTYLVYGFGCLFKIDEATIGLHQDERKSRQIANTGSPAKGSEETSRGDDDASNLGGDGDTLNDSEGDDEDEVGEVKETEGDEDNDCEDCLEDVDGDEEDENVDELSGDLNAKMAIKDKQATQTGKEEGFSSLLSDSKEKNSTQNGGVDDAEEEGQSEEEEEREGDVKVGDIKVDIDCDEVNSVTPTLDSVEKDCKSVTFDFPETNVDLATMIKKPKAKPTQSKKQQNQKSANNKQPVEKGSGDKQYKRGQKAKLKRIKQKYADQDENERTLRMSLLCSAGEAKPTKKGRKLQEKEEKYAAATARRLKKEQKDKEKEEQAAASRAALSHLEAVDADLKDDPYDDPAAAEDADPADIQVPQDNLMLTTLSGQPCAEDDLLFCVPMCAPYGVFANYKYKVKLTPGNSKKGKAATSCIHMFSVDKNATAREKEMFKSLKGLDLSRNIPGKVKISASNQNKKNKK